MVDAVSNTVRVLVYQLESDDAKRAFTELCRFGMALSQRFNPIADTIHEIRALAQREVVNLPSEATAILDGSEMPKAHET